MDVLNATPWGTDWAWSLPLILFNVIIHVFGLALIFDAFTLLLRKEKIRHRFVIQFAKVMSASVLLIVALSWTRGGYLGPRLSFSGRTPGQQVGDALLAWCDDRFRGWGRFLAA